MTVLVAAVRQCLAHGWSPLDLSRMLLVARGTVVALGKGRLIAYAEGRILDTLGAAGVDVSDPDEVADALLTSLADGAPLGSRPPLACSEAPDGTRYHVALDGVYDDGTVLVRRTRGRKPMAPALARVCGGTLVELEGRTEGMPARVLADLAEQLQGVLDAPPHSMTMPG